MLNSGVVASIVRAWVYQFASDDFKMKSGDFHPRPAAFAAAVLMALLLAGLTFSAAVMAQAAPLSSDPSGSVTSRTQNPPNSSDIAASIASQEVALEQARSNMAILDLSIASAQEYLDQSRLDLADADNRLAIAEDQYNRSLQIFDGRLTQIYKLGENEDYAVLVSSDNFGDAVSRISYLASISENDQRLVDRVREQAQLVQSLHQQIDNIKQNQARGFNDLLNQRGQLQSQIDTGVRNIDAAQAQLAQAQAREQAKEAGRLAREAAASADRFTADGMDGGTPIVVGDSQPDGLQPSGVILRGVASWYGPGFNGQHTADGENYDMFAYTAASKTLPFGTWLKVTFNDRSVFVRINDRGPYVGDRILDLSYASAQAIGLTGIGYVTAEIYR